MAERIKKAEDENADLREKFAIEREKKETYMHRLAEIDDWFNREEGNDL